jgi:hypothetical protein
MSRIVYDVKLKRPGCVLLQAAMGGTVLDFVQKFPNEWLLAPTPDMKIYEVTDDQLNVLSAMNQSLRPVAQPEGRKQ